MTREDEAREERIFKSYLELTTAKDTGTRRAAWDAMCSEVKLRSPRRVAEMEAQKGLR